MKRVKTFLRATMSQERLNHAAVCAAYGRELRTLDRSRLMREFIGVSAQRTNLFGAP